MEYENNYFEEYLLEKIKFEKKETLMYKLISNHKMVFKLLLYKR